MYAFRRKKPRKPSEIQKLIQNNHLYFIYIVVLALLIFTMLSKNHLLLFLLVTLLSSVINYHTNMTTMRFNPAPEIFFSLFLTRVAGLGYGLFMLLVPLLFIDIYTARLDIDTFVALILTVLINLIMSIFPTMNFVVLGIILITFKFITGLFINLALDISIQEILFEHVLGFITNMMFIMAFGNILLNLFM